MHMNMYVAMLMSSNGVIILIRHLAPTELLDTQIVHRKGIIIRTSIQHTYIRIFVLGMAVGSVKLQL